ncbi:MAG TPA: polysaccharide deacetylase family protein [bacterium]
MERIWCRATCLAVATATVLLPFAAIAGEAGPSEALSLERGRRDQPRVALTFDGGSDAGDTELILAVLADRGVTATFFLTGEFMERHPDLVRRIAAGGHEVGNHTWSHPHLTTWERTHRHDTLPGLDRERMARELARTADAYERLTGLPLAPLWRAPYGELNDEIARWAGTAGWQHVGWSREGGAGRHTLDSLDWVADRSSRNFFAASRLLERILSFDARGAGLNGGIVLMHLCARRDDPLSARLGALVDELRARGYQPCTVGELRRELGPPATVVALAAPQALH